MVVGGWRVTQEHATLVIGCDDDIVEQHLCIFRETNTHRHSSQFFSSLLADLADVWMLLTRRTAFTTKLADSRGLAADDRELWRLAGPPEPHRTCRGEGPGSRAQVVHGQHAGGGACGGHTVIVAGREGLAADWLRHGRGGGEAGPRDGKVGRGSRWRCEETGQRGGEYVQCGDESG